MYNKLGIGPVVGSALLLVVAVVAVIGFQNWYTTFQSTTLVDIDEESSSSNSLQIQGLSYGNLYFKSGESNISSLRIISEKTGTEMCIFSDNSQSINENNLVGLWKLDDESSIIEDLSGNENHGTLYGDTRILMNFDNGNSEDSTGYNNSGIAQNGATWTNSNCISGGCYSFDGVDDYISSSNDLSLNLTGDVTISYWLHINANPAFEDGLLVSYSGNGESSDTNQIFATQLFTNGRIQIDQEYGTGINENYIFDTNLSQNVWYHILAKRDSNLKEWELYIDGEKFGNYSYINDPEGGSSNLFLVGGFVTGTWNPNVNLDEINVFSKKLSQSEIQNLYNSQRAKFIEFIDSPIDKAVEFDGIDDYILINQSSFSLNNNFSLVAITKHKFLSQTNPEGNQRYISLFNQSISSLAVLRYDWNIKSHFYLRTDSLYHARSYDSPELNKYDLFVGTYNNSEVLLYKNNAILIANESTTGSINFQIGDPIYFSYPLDSEAMDGFIDEIRIYNKSLSEDEIKDLYFYSIKQTNDGTNSIDLSSCNLENNQPYQIQLFTNDGSVIESRFNN